MTVPNPFAQNVPVQQQPAAAPEQQVNPYAQPTAAPQAYAPPATAPNPYAQPAQPQYAPAPVAPNPYAQPAAAPQAYAPAAPALDPRGAVAVGAPVVGEGKGAKLPDMYGRLVLVFPLGLETVPRRPEHITAEQRAAGNVNQERLTATVVVLDDGQGGMQPIGFGGQAGPPPIPHTDFVALPYVRRGMWLSQSRLISQLRDAVPGPGRQQGMRVGRVVKAGPAATDAWYLQTPTDQEVGLANQYLALVQAGTYPAPWA